MESEYDTEKILNQIVKGVREGIPERLLSSYTQLAIWKLN